MKQQRTSDDEETKEEMVEDQHIETPTIVKYNSHQEKPTDRFGNEQQYTEDYVIMYRNQLIEGLPEFKLQIDAMVKRISNQNPILVEALSQKHGNNR